MFLFIYKDITESKEITIHLAVLKHLFPTKMNNGCCFSVHTIHLSFLKLMLVSRSRLLGFIHLNQAETKQDAMIIGQKHKYRRKQVNAKNF